VSAKLVLCHPAALTGMPRPSQILSSSCSRPANTNTSYKLQIPQQKTLLGILSWKTATICWTN